MTITILLHVVVVSFAMTTPPNPFWQPGIMNQIDFWNYQHASPVIASPPPASIFPYQTPGIPPTTMPNPHISLDHLFKLIFAGVSGSAPSQASGSGSLAVNASSQTVQQVPKTVTTTTTSTPQPTTTTTTTTRPKRVTTTVPTPTTLSPKLTLREILFLQSLKTTTPKTKGCFFKNRFYSPLTQIDRGQIGEWCWGSYCNHESKVVHWDDHQCTIPTTPPPPTTTTQDPNQHGCIYEGMWFAPGQDIENYRDFGRCYGTYCDYNSRVQTWEDRCIATVAPAIGPQSNPSMNIMSMLSKKR